MSTVPDLVLRGGRIATGDPQRPHADSVSIRDGRILRVGTDREILVSGEAEVIELEGRTVIPGLIDSHIHTIRGGLNYNLELRWGGVPSLAEALRRLRAQAERTPAPQWVRVVGGWNEFQFAEANADARGEPELVAGRRVWRLSAGACPRTS